MTAAIPSDKGHKHLSGPLAWLSQQPVVREEEWIPLSEELLGSNPGLGAPTTLTRLLTAFSVLYIRLSSLSRCTHFGTGFELRSSWLLRHGSVTMYSSGRSVL